MTTQEPTVRNARLNQLEVPSGNATINGQNVTSAPSSSSSVSPGFGSWQNTGSGLTLVLVEATAETDGASIGNVEVDVDEDGGTTADYSVSVANVDSDANAGTAEDDTALIPVPDGGAYQVANDSDPNTNNAINTVREFSL